MGRTTLTPEKREMRELTRGEMLRATTESVGDNEVHLRWKSRLPCPWTQNRTEETKFIVKDRRNFEAASSISHTKARSDRRRRR